MKLSELKHCIERISMAHQDVEDPDVVIHTSNPGIPHNHMVQVKYAVMGFDWTHGLFIVSPTEPLVVVNRIDQPLSNVAEKRLAEFKATHKELGFEYIKKCREREWLQGFREGVRMHITACGSKAPEEG